MSVITKIKNTKMLDDRGNEMRDRSGNIIYTRNIIMFADSHNHSFPQEASATIIQSTIDKFNKDVVTCKAVLSDVTTYVAGKRQANKQCSGSNEKDDFAYQVYYAKQPQHPGVKVTELGC
tara:strand:+ start:366 stop:725 length:360 start_codon:yes stop_codon:yes gene_type:complete